MTDAPPSAARPRSEDPAVKARRAARLGAVQALYQIEMTGTPVTQAIDEFTVDHLPLDADREFFILLVNGVQEHGEEIDRRLTEVLVEGWSLARLETVLRAIFRAGICELLTRWDVPPRVTIKEYVEIANSFFGGREPGMVNGVMDKIGRSLRPADFERG